MKVFLTTSVRRYFSTQGCGPLKEFREVMFDTYRKNQQKILRILSTRGINYSLFMLSALKDDQMPSSHRKQLISNLQNSDQKMTDKAYRVLCERLPEQTSLHHKYKNPSLRFTNQTQFTINDITIKTYPLENAFNIDYSSFDKFAFDKTSPLISEGDKEQDLKVVTKLSGEQLNHYIRNIISQEQLFFDQNKDELFFKFNEKLLKHYPSNVVFRYVMDSRKYPLQLNLIDLPYPFIMEEISQKKSLLQLVDTVQAANIFNLISKIKETRHPERTCPTCSKTDIMSTSPDGYYNVLSQDDDLFSNNKVKYIMSEIDKIVKQMKKGKLGLVLSNQYASIVRDQLKKYQKTGKLDHQVVTIEKLRKQVLKRTSQLQQQGEAVLIPLKKSIIIELLFQINAVDSAEYFKSLGGDIADKYFQAIMQYGDMLTLDALDPAAGSKLQGIFQKQPCQLLQLIFGNEQQMVETAYEQSTVKKMFERLDSQTKHKGDSGKIKLNKQL